MIVRLAYDTSLDPPAPVVPMTISGPSGEDAVLLPMLVDTGADCTVVPVAIARLLGLVRVDRIGLTGVGGASIMAPVHAASVTVLGLRVLARVVAFGDEAILGRDVLNQVVLTLDGPGLTISSGGRSGVRRPKRAPPRS